MQILILPYSLSYGGAEKQAVIDAKLLAKKHLVWLGYFVEGPLSSQVEENITKVQFKKGNYFITALKLARFLKSNKIEVLQTSLYAPMIISALASIFAPVKVIWSFHSHEYELPVIHKKVYWILARLPNVKRILFVNYELKQFYRNLHISFPKSKTGILYNSGSESIAPDILKKSNEKPVVTIGYIGRLVSLKRVDYLVELADFLANHKIVNFKIEIAGDGEEKTSLIELTKEKKISDFVSFLGFRSDTANLYKTFDVFVNPSEEECLSLAIIDAGMHGLPAVAFDVGGNNEIISNENSGYIVESKEEFFLRVKLLIENAALREQMGHEAYEVCHEKFSPEKHAEELLNCMNSV